MSDPVGLTISFLDPVALPLINQYESLTLAMRLRNCSRSDLDVRRLVDSELCDVIKVTIASCQAANPILVHSCEN
jgi:hypothetical protein